MFFRRDSEFIEEAVVPDFLHIIPVGDDTVLNRILELENTSFSLGFISNIGFLLVHADHDSRHFRSSNDGGEVSSWCIISSDTCFAHTRSIINDNCCCFV
jgi:hypothetical protein